VLSCGIFLCKIFHILIGLAMIAVVRTWLLGHRSSLSLWTVDYLMKTWWRWNMIFYKLLGIIICIADLSGDKYVDAFLQLPSDLSYRMDHKSGPAD